MTKRLGCMLTHGRRADIKRKFYLLENLQGERLTESLDPSSENSRWRLDESDEARMRNRYSNIAAWETNRIRLNVPVEHSDYINASPIVLTSKRDGSVKRYIATQVSCRSSHVDGGMR